MKIVTEEWKFYISLILGVLLLIPLGVLWFVSLGHVKLVSTWWKFLDKHAREYLYG